MKTRIIRINQEDVKSAEIQTISGIVSSGGVIVYPTDTYYGLGADCFSKRAIRKIYGVKRRGLTKPLPLLVADVEMARRIAAEIPPLFLSLSVEFWPGPLTLVLKAGAALPAELIGPRRTIGIRLPAVPWLRKLIRRAGFPLIATSANISGEAEIAAAEQVIQVFNHRVDLIVDGGQTPGSLPSTVVDLTSGQAILLREGAISKSRLKKYLT